MQRLTGDQNRLSSSRHAGLLDVELVDQSCCQSDIVAHIPELQILYVLYCGGHVEREILDCDVTQERFQSSEGRWFLEDGWKDSLQSQPERLETWGEPLRQVDEIPLQILVNFSIGLPVPRLPETSTFPASSEGLATSTNPQGHRILPRCWQERILPAAPTARKSRQANSLHRPS